jgi:hypothetical protein
MFTPAILMAAALTSDISTGPQQQTAGPSEQYETLEDLFDSRTGTWTNLSPTLPKIGETAREDAAADSLYKPLVRETLRTPPPRPAGLFFFGITR